MKTINPILNSNPNPNLISHLVFYVYIVIVRDRMYGERWGATSGSYPSLMELSSSPAEQSRHHPQTVQTTAEGTPFLGSMNTALCDSLPSEKHLLTYYGASESCGWRLAMLNYSSTAWAPRLDGKWYMVNGLAAVPAQAWMSPSPKTTAIGPQFLATFFDLKTTTFHEGSSVWAIHVALSVWPYLYAKVYDLSLRIRPFQGPIYTVIGPFYPRVPPVGGDSGVVWARSGLAGAKRGDGVLGEGSQSPPRPARR